MHQNNSGVENYSGGTIRRSISVENNSSSTSKKNSNVENDSFATLETEQVALYENFCYILFFSSLKILWKCHFYQDINLF